ncbi:hypothetical protein [Ovoidimarina sediminis]|uniref:hypothetical protein n=1 Tax=Ovoidimarina sediminis TaxID=3079856 RepID=UPI002911507E|nr:hypothetical protein [Rhodophyticola sp. MJ-SS7]MDU8943772.1 hypothetical protein [Rhodophyticola sp. MJ-SS7]
MRTALGLILGLSIPFLSVPAEAAEQQRIRGEFIDTWCYFSGVMGGPDAVQGTAHHTCAIWCSAGGIPVGLLAEDGTVYMILSINGDDQSASGDTQLALAAHTVTADATVYRRDGLNYITIESIVEDEGIINMTHEDYGVIPPFAIPDPAK